MNYLSRVYWLLQLECILGFFAKDVNSILQWIVSGLYGGYIAANVFKWYWWRFNANGFFWGMVAGIAGALVFSIDYLQAWNSFIISRCYLLCQSPVASLVPILHHQLILAY